MAKLRGMLKISGDTPGFVVNPSVQATFDLFNVLVRPRAINSTVDISAGGKTLATVPSGRRWFIYTIHRRSVGSLGRVFVTKLDNSDPPVAVNHFHILTTAEQTVWVGELLASGDSIGIAQGGVGDTAILMTVGYAEYEVEEG